ncbi:MAG: type IV pilin protein [Candidatus Xenobia bacterium]
MKRRARGFTLIELMIVIVIIGILLTILIPAWQNSRYQTQLTACEYNERALAAAMEVYNSSQGHYTGNLSDLTQSLNGANPCINGIPTCPTNDQQYTVTVSLPDQSNYTLACPGGSHFLTLPFISQNFPQYNASTGLLLH